jgi:hypothetical protein
MVMRELQIYIVQNLLDQGQPHQFPPQKNHLTQNYSNVYNLLSSHFYLSFLCILIMEVRTYLHQNKATFFIHCFLRYPKNHHTIESIFLI